MNPKIVYLEESVPLKNLLVNGKATAGALEQSVEITLVY